MWRLMAKEWRENRLLVLGLVLLAPAASVAVKWWLVGWERTAPFDSIFFLVPGLLGLFLVGVAADLVAADAGSGRAAFLAALPVRPIRVWAAKAAFLFLGGALYLGWLLIVEAAILAAAGLDPGHLGGNGTPDRAWRFLVPVVAGAATLFFSTLLDRGLAAVFAALATLAGLGAAFACGAAAAGVDPKPGGPAFAPFAALLAAAFLAGSALAFARGRIHLRARLRRLGLAAAGFLLVLLPPVGFATAAVAEWRRLDPSDSGLVIHHLEVHPSGRWAVVGVGADRKRGPLGVAGPVRRWALSLSDGTLRDLTDLGHQVAFLPDDGPDRVRALRLERVPGERGFTRLVTLYDLAAGEVVWTRPSDVAAGLPGDGVPWGDLRFHRVSKRGRVFLLPDGREFTLPEGAMYHLSTAPWGIVVSRFEGAGRERKLHWEVFDGERGEALPVATPPTLLPPARDGTAWAVRGHGDGSVRVLRVPLDGSEPETVLEGRGAAALSKDLRRAAVALGERVFLLDRGDPAPREVPVPGTGPVRTLVLTEDGAALLVVGEEGCALVGSEGGKVHATPVPWPTWDGDRVWFDGRRALVLEGRGRRLDLHVLGGEPRRLLPVP